MSGVCIGTIKNKKGKKPNEADRDNLARRRIKLSGKEDRRAPKKSERISNEGSKSNNTRREEDRELLGLD